VWGSNPYEGKMIFYFLGGGGWAGGGLTRAKPGGCTSNA
jgi:hypothetical protein